MADSQGTALTFERAPPPRLPEVVRWLLAGWPAEERESAADLLLPRLADGRAAELIAVSALRGASLQAAALALRMPGRVALVWAPALTEGADESLAGQVLQSLADELRKEGVDLAQALLAPGDEVASGRLRQAGWQAAATILCLVSDLSQVREREPNCDFAWAPYQPADRERMIRLIDATYAGTLDCPALNGLRRTDDVLAGYAATGVHRPELWQFLRCGEQDVGCLLLADHPALEQTELMYMGLTPAARGQGWSRQIVRWAQWRTRESGRARLVLTVDSANHPAIVAYGTSGFSCWDERSVWLLSLARQGSRAS